MVSRLPWIRLFGTVILCVASQSTAAAQEDPCGDELPENENNLLALRWQILNRTALKDVLEGESLRLKNDPLTPHETSLPPLFPDPEELLRNQLQPARDERRKALATLKEHVEKRVEEAKKAWCQAYAEERKVRERWREAEAHYGSRAKGDEWRVWDLGTLAITAWGIGLFLISVLLNVHGRRRQIRSRIRFNGKMGVISASLLIVIAGSLASFSHAQGKTDDRREVDDLRQKLDELDKRISNLRKDADALRDERFKTLAASFPEGKDGFRKEMLNSEKQAAEDFRQRMQTAKLIELAGKASSTIQDDIDKEQAKLAEFTSNGQDRFRVNAGIKIALCFIFIVLAFLPLRRLDRTKRAEQVEQAKRCPCCLATDSLEVKSSDAQNIQTAAELTYLKCSECQYEMRASYQKLPRLCFPTVGIRTSGKTHWLVTAYDLIKNSKVPVPAAIQSAPSMMDQEFDIYINQILEQHTNARATAHSAGIFPYPLIFHLKDCDRLGKNDGMLNLFDFSGEIMEKRVNTNVLRQRALLMDGFVLFLDPTQVKSNKGGASLKTQVEILTSFHQEIRDMRGVDVGTPIPMPIAVCISKLDLVTTQNPLSMAALPWLKSLRESFTRPTTLAEIKLRSRLCEQMLPLLFPGWNLSRTLSEHFGGRFLFFPLTPVSLGESELGVSNLKDRTFAPVGILEPILWLMHMHGFKVFK